MHSKGVRWMKVCHPCKLSVLDYHRYRQLISRLPYTQSPWGPITSSKGIVEISSQLQRELGSENLYTLFSCSPFSFEIEFTVESLWSDIIDLHNIFFCSAMWMCIFQISNLWSELLHQNTLRRLETISIQGFAMLRGRLL